MISFKQFLTEADTDWKSGGDHWGKVGDFEFDVSYVKQAANNLPRVSVHPSEIKYDIVDQPTVDKHAALMKAGDWKWDEEPLLAQKTWVDNKGQQQPISVMDGNHRVAAAIQAGLDEVKIVYVDELLEKIKAEGNKKVVRPAGEFNYRKGDR